MSPKLATVHPRRGPAHNVSVHSVLLGEKENHLVPETIDGALQESVAQALPRCTANIAGLPCGLGRRKSFTGCGADCIKRPGAYAACGEKNILSRYFREYLSALRVGVKTSRNIAL